MLYYINIYFLNNILLGKKATINIVEYLKYVEVCLILLGNYKSQCLRARPILRWSPRRPGSIACDISVGNVLAVANTKLIGEYLQVAPRLKDSKTLHTLCEDERMSMLLRAIKAGLRLTKTVLRLS